MKKILLAISMMLSLMACVKEVITLPSETVDTDGEVVLNISAVVPEAQIATKGTFAAPTITSINVLMFDDKGFMVANAVAYAAFRLPCCFHNPYGSDSFKYY